MIEISRKNPKNFRKKIENFLKKMVKKCAKKGAKIVPIFVEEKCRKWTENATLGKAAAQGRGRMPWFFAFLRVCIVSDPKLKFGRH